MSGKQVAATLTVDFIDDQDDDDSNGKGVGDNAGNNRVSLSQMTRVLNMMGQLLAKCHPADGVTFTTSEGSVSPGETRSFTTTETIKFSNSSRVGLQFPKATNVSIGSHVLLKKQKDSLGKTTLVRTSCNVYFDSDTNEVCTTLNGEPVDVYGGCTVTYTAAYRVLYYVPKFTPFLGGGGSFTVGTIYGYNEYDVGSVDMEMDFQTEETEYARLYRKIVLTPEGAFESPDGWPGNTNINGYELDPDNSFTDELPVCTAIVNQYGALYFRRYHAPLLDAISPTYYWTIAKPELKWAKIFLDIDADRVESVFNLEIGTSSLVYESKEPRAARS